MPRKVAKAVARGGRPSRADALRLRERILDAAAELFLAHGYGATSIEAVVKYAGVSKRTLYDRFADKSQLFAAVVHHIIDRIRPPPDVPLLEGSTLPDMLRRLALLILRAALAPQALALHRLVIAESARFPELARTVAGDASNREATELIGGLLRRELADGQLGGQPVEFAAAQFIFMVVAVPQRRAIGYGPAMKAKELERWAGDVVNLFLNGCRQFLA